MSNEPTRSWHVYDPETAGVQTAGHARRCSQNPDLLGYVPFRIWDLGRPVTIRLVLPLQHMIHPPDMVLQALGTRLLSGISTPDPEKFCGRFDFWWMAMLTAFHSIIFPHSSSHDVPFPFWPPLSEDTLQRQPSTASLLLHIHCVTKFRQHVQISACTILHAHFSRYNNGRIFLSCWPRPNLLMLLMMWNLASSWFPNATFGWYCLVLSSFRFPAVRPRHAGESNSSRTCTPPPLLMSSTYTFVSWIESSRDVWPVRSFLIISVAGEFPCHDLALYSASDYPQDLRT